MMSAPSAVQDLLASQPQKQICAELFTFNLLSGPIHTFTDWRRPITVAGTTYQPGPPRLGRGTIKLERGVSVSTTEVTFQEANATFIAFLAQGYFNRAIFRQQRVFRADSASPWTPPIVKFFGRVDNISGITRTTAKLSIKCMLDDLDNDYPRDVIETDCNAVLFDQRCGLSSANYQVSDAAAAGSTKNKLLSGLSNPDVYFTQGVVTFTSGILYGLSYMVKAYAAGVVYPAYPFLVAPAVGDTFTITPGCDKTLATCQSKYSYNPEELEAPYFRGLPFVPDPTVTY